MKPRDFNQLMDELRELVERKYDDAEIAKMLDISAESAYHYRRGIQWREKEADKK